MVNNNINKIKVFVLGFISILICSVGISATSNSATAPQKDIEFSIKTVQSKNQLDKSKTYFHLLAKPGSKQRVEFDINNTSARVLKIKAKASTALTNKNGVIIYDGGQNNEKISSTMKIKSDDIVKLDTDVINVAANSTKRIGATITMPKTSVDGIVLGGFNFILDEEKTEVKSGVESKYQYNIGLILSQKNSKKLLQSDSLELNNIETKVFDGSKVTVFDFDNIKAHMISDMKLDFNITKKDGKETILSHTDQNLSIAPNTILSYNLDWGIKDLKPGVYTAHIKGKSLEKDWLWTKDFEIKDDQAKELNDSAVNKLYYPNWFKFSIALLSIATIINVVVVFKQNRKSKEV